MHSKRQLTKAKQAELARLEKQRSEFNKLFSKILFGVSALSLAQQLIRII